MIARRGESNAEPPASILIRPTRGWAAPNLREVWAYRELLYFFIWRDLKVRYKQTLFGVLWAVIQPLMLMVVFSLFLGRMSGIAPPGIPYPLFAFAGLVPWTLFSTSLSGSSDSLVSSSNLIQKVYFPRLLLPLSALGSHIVDFAIAMAVLGLLLVSFGHPPSIDVVWTIPLMLLLLTIALAAGIWLSAANVRYRDVRYVVPFLVQLLLFASPVAYSVDIVPRDWLWLYRLNPVAPVVEGFRWALLGETPPPVEAIVAAVLVTLVVLASGLAYFRRVERTFADVI